MGGIRPFDFSMLPEYRDFPVLFDDRKRTINSNTLNLLEKIRKTGLVATVCYKRSR